MVTFAGNRWRVRVVAGWGYPAGRRRRARPGLRGFPGEVGLGKPAASPASCVGTGRALAVCEIRVACQLLVHRTRSTCGPGSVKTQSCARSRKTPDRSPAWPWPPCRARGDRGWKRAPTASRTHELSPRRTTPIPARASYTRAPPAPATWGSHKSIRTCTKAPPPAPRPPDRPAVPIVAPIRPGHTDEPETSRRGEAAVRPSAADWSCGGPESGG
jgi:hypothetical protein